MFSILDVHFKQISEAAKKPAVSGSCKILLLFSEDGVPFSDQAVEWARQVPEEVRKLKCCSRTPKLSI